MGRPREARGAKRPSRPLSVKKTAGKEKPKKTPSIKNRLRALTRTLQRGQLSPQQQKEREQVVRELTEKRQAVERAALEKKYAIRYHKVKFFERRKLERSLKQAKLALSSASAPEERDALRAKVAAIEEDLQYVRHFPKLEPYVSILRAAENAEAQAELDAKRQRLKQLIRQSLSDSALLTEVNEGRPASPGSPAVPAKSSLPATPRRSQKTGVAPDNEASNLGHERSSELPSRSPKAKRQKFASEHLPATQTLSEELPEEFDAANGVGPKAAAGGSMAEQDDFFLPSDAAVDFTLVDAVPVKVPMLPAKQLQQPKKEQHPKKESETISPSGKKKRNKEKQQQPKVRRKEKKEGFQPKQTECYRTEKSQSVARSHRTRAEGGRKRSKKKQS